MENTTLQPSIFAPTRLFEAQDTLMVIYDSMTALLANPKLGPHEIELHGEPSGTHRDYIKHYSTQCDLPSCITEDLMFDFIRTLYEEPGSNVIQWRPVLEATPPSTFDRIIGHITRQEQLFTPSISMARDEFIARYEDSFAAYIAQHEKPEEQASASPYIVPDPNAVKIDITKDGLPVTTTRLAKKTFVSYKRAKTGSLDKKQPVPPTTRLQYALVNLGGGMIAVGAVTAIVSLPMLALAAAGIACTIAGALPPRVKKKMKAPLYSGPLQYAGANDRITPPHPFSKGMKTAPIPTIIYTL